ncbi:MAG: DUF5670 family protein [Chitinophagaceae bacterium]
MGKLLYIVGLLLIAGWLIGVIWFHAAAAIHILLVMGLVLIVMRYFSEKKSR